MATLETLFSGRHGDMSTQFSGTAQTIGSWTGFDTDVFARQDKTSRAMPNFKRAQQIHFESCIWVGSITARW